LAKLLFSVECLWNACQNGIPCARGKNLKEKRFCLRELYIIFYQFRLSAKKSLVLLAENFRQGRQN